MSDDQRRSRVCVLGSFSLTCGSTTIPLGVDSRRLVAYLAVHPRPQERAALAADLWPGIPAAAAARQLTEAVDGVDVPGLLDPSEATLAFAAGVEVDLAVAMTLIRALPGIAADAVTDTTALDADVLPGWTAAWIVIERERFRQLRLHAIEERSLRLSAAGRYDGAVEMAQLAVATAPSRESARRALIEAHLAQGNIAAAVAEYDKFQELMRSSVGGPVPSSGLEGLFPPNPVWPVLRSRPVMPRSAVQLPGIRAVRGSAGPRRLVAGGSVPGTSR